MPIQYNCQHCNQLLNVPDGSEGKQCKCPHCGSVMAAPRQAQTSGPFSSPHSSPLPHNPYAASGGQFHSTAHHRAPLVLTFGILSLAIGLFTMCCVITFPLSLGFGIAAAVMGHNDLKAMRGSQINGSGRGMTQAVMICGIIAIVLSGLGGLGLILSFAWDGMIRL